MERDSAGAVPTSPQASDSISTSSTSTDSSPTASALSPAASVSSTLPSDPGTSAGLVNPVNAAPPAKKVKKGNYDVMGAKATLRGDWDPERFAGTVVPSSIAMSRIKKDLQEFHKHPPEGIYLLVRDKDISCLDVLIVGPEDTPYQGGFFHFYLSFSDKYPFEPPRVKIMTTGNGKVRFNPNFYKNGKVCLSILGTWSGPQWNASQTLISVLCSIQSLMSEEPYRNEPGYEKMKKDDKKATDYRFIVKHETLRVAVCDTVKGVTTCPKPFIEHVVKPAFLKNHQSYLDIVSGEQDAQPVCMFGENHGPFSFTNLEERLLSLKTELVNEPVSTEKKTEEDYKILGVAISDETVHLSPEPSSKRNATWMEFEHHSPGDEDFSDIFDVDDDEDDGGDDHSDLSDYQEDESGGVTCTDQEKRQDNNNKGEDARGVDLEEATSA